MKLITSILLTTLGLSSFSQVTCINFDDTTFNQTVSTSQTSYPSTPFYSKNNVDFYVKYHDYTFDASTSTDSYGFQDATSWVPYNTNFSGNVLVPGDVDIKADFTNIGYAFKLQFDANARSGHFTIHGVNIDTTYSAAGSGLNILVEGQIDSIIFHGFENAFDNLCYSDTNFSLSVDELKSTNFDIYPNPTSSHAKINSDDLIEEVELYNSQGKLIESVTINSFNKELDLSTYKRGIYFVKASFENKSTATQRIVLTD